MGSRIVTLQRQARELGRLRTGVFNTTGKGRPERSKTWILTTHQRAYLDAAVDLYGGTVEAWTPQRSKEGAWRLITETNAIDAILPPGDPLSQSYEMWSGGGCKRRCDGVTEELSQTACPCKAQFGEEFFLRRPEEVCRPHTRLSVILPDMPDLGVWRMETKSFYSANEVPATVDLIMHATQGKLAVPVSLRIEPRKRVANGETKNFPVIVIEARGATAGQLMAGQPATLALDAGGRAAIGPAVHAAAAIESAPAAPAAPSLTVAQALAMVAAARSVEQLALAGKDIGAAGLTDQGVRDAWTARKRELTAPAQEPAPVEAAAPPAAEDDVVEAEDADELDALWGQVMLAAGKRTPAMNADQLEALTQQATGKASSVINAAEMRTVLAEIKAGRVAA